MASAVRASSAIAVVEATAALLNRTVPAPGSPMVVDVAKSYLSPTGKAEAMAATAETSADTPATVVTSAEIPATVVTLAEIPATVVTLAEIPATIAVSPSTAATRATSASTAATAVM